MNWTRIRDAEHPAGQRVSKSARDPTRSFAEANEWMGHS